jgi:dipeptidyl-peptidase III
MSAPKNWAKESGLSRVIMYKRCQESVQNLPKREILRPTTSNTLSLSYYIDSFRTGRLDKFRQSQKSWVTDISPNFENMIGFVEPCRDPYGIRAEWKGVICISDTEETKRLKHFVDASDTFIPLLPLAVAGGSNVKGRFEKTFFEPPDFASVHGK